MDHKHFEDWILSDGDLSAGDRRELNEHLAVCDRCDRLHRSWRSARGKLTAAAAAAPAPGFSARFAQRLEQDNARRRDRRSFALIAGAFAAAVLYLSIYGVRFLELIAENAGTALAQIDELSAITATVRTAFPTSLDLSATAPLLLAPLAVMVFFAAVGAGAIAWLKMFRLLARVQGFTEWA